MPNYTGRDRSYRRAERTRGEQSQPDAATAALTAQVIICILLLLCAAAIKKTNEAGYVRFKEQYRIMLNDSSQMGKTIEWLYGFGDVFDRFRNPDTDDYAQPEIDIDEPEDEPEAATAFQYDYLDAHASAQVSSGIIAVPAGSVLPASQMNPPVSGIITSGFAYRSHPMTKKLDYHTGIDIAAEEGTPVTAVLSGIVEEVGQSEIYGNYIIIRHTPKLKTSYSHCSKIIAEENMPVRQGERIALVGQTGSATGPHLHFSVIDDGEFIDPGNVLGGYIRQVRR